MYRWYTCFLAAAVKIPSEILTEIRNGIQSRDTPISCYINIHGTTDEYPGLQDREILCGSAEILHGTGMLGNGKWLRFCVNNFTVITMGVEIRETEYPFSGG